MLLLTYNAAISPLRVSLSYATLQKYRREIEYRGVWILLMAFATLYTIAMSSVSCIAQSFIFAFFSFSAYDPAMLEILL